MAQKLSSLAVGAKVKDANTTYYGKPIVWLVADINHTGYPTNSVTLMAEKILCLKAFDGKEASNSDSGRRQWGNNRYLYSNIRQWLNSSGAANSWYTPQHNADASPTDENCLGGWNGYDTEAGFLAGFSPQMKQALLSTTLTVAKNQDTDGGGTESVVDKIFLASTTEVGLFNELGIAEGSKLALFNDVARRQTYPTAEAVANSEYVYDGWEGSNGLSADKLWWWWLRTAYGTDANPVRIVTANNGLSSNSAYFGSAGIRPLCNISSDTLVSDAPDADGAYKIILNTAPTPVTGFTAPNPFRSERDNVLAWSGATDVDGNLAGYKLRRSVDLGNSWTQIYQGAAATTTDRLDYNQAVNVMYSVCSYDSQGAESAWYTSAPIPVVNNRPPTAPPSINVPLAIYGGEPVTITWSASSDPENNLTGYVLERSVNGAANTVVTTINALTYVDTAGTDWSTVTYRVKARDEYGDESAYATSPTRTVDTNKAPVITCAITNKGLVTADFTIPYSVSDADGDAISVSEYIDGVLLRKYTAADGAAQTMSLTGLTFMCMLNGGHSLKITATDSRGKSSTHTVTCVKQVYKVVIQSKPKLAEDDQMITKCVLNLSGNIPKDVDLKIFVSNNAKDTTPAWEDITDKVKLGQAHLFGNATATNGYYFAYLITAERADGGEGGYISGQQGGFE